MATSLIVGIISVAGISFQLLAVPAVLVLIVGFLVLFMICAYRQSQLADAAESNDEAELSVQMVSLRDNETGGHTKRVTLISGRIGTCMGLKGPELVRLVHGAQTHDIGKVGIPDAILLKSGPLTAEETRVMRSHVEIGMQILSGFTHLKQVMVVCAQHHERWDGFGYPMGLKGEEIDIKARIFMVADAVDAIVSERPYKPAQTLETALRLVKDASGTQFDPSVVTVVLNNAQEIFEGVYTHTPAGVIALDSISVL